MINSIVGSSKQKVITPEVFQMNRIDSGIASLLILLRFYNRETTQEQLRGTCGIENGRIRLSNLIQGAKAHGFQAKAAQCQMRTLKTQSYLLPAIVLWKSTHFLVVESFQNNQVFINNPEVGRRQISEDTFQKEFSNLALFITPGRNFHTLATPSISTTKTTLQEKLQRGIKGYVSPPTGHLEKYTSDFGGVVQKQPRLIVRATCEQDIIHTFKVAQESDVPVHIRGAGHSCQGQSLIEDGILLVNVADHVQMKMIDAYTASVSTRSRWSYFEQELNQVGQTFPVLTDNLTTTIGGTLSVGGYGPRSISHGAQVNQVKRIRLIQPNGEPVWCSRSENSALFQYSLAGLGQVGFMERVEVHTISKPDSVVWYQREHPTASGLVDSLLQLAECEKRPLSFMAFHLQGQGFYSCYGFQKESLNSQFASSLQQEGASQTKSPINLGPIYRTDMNEGVYCLAVDYVLPPTKLHIFLTELDNQLQNEHVAKYIRGALLLAVKNDPIKHLPFEASAFGSAPLNFLVGFYPVIPRNDKAGLRTIQQAMKIMLDVCVELGGRPYLYGWHDLDKPSLDKLYGSDLSNMQALRHTLDPKKLYAPSIHPNFQRGQL